MKEDSGNKNITPSEKRKKRFFYAVAEGEGDIGTLAQKLCVSRTTVRRYARDLENAGIVRFMISGGKCRKKVRSIGLCPNLRFAIVKIGAKKIEISVFDLPKKYEYSVALPYNEALSDTENAFCVKRNLEKLCAQAFSDRTLVGVILADGACMDLCICREIFGGTVLSVFECKAIATKNETERSFTMNEGFCEPPRAIRSNKGNEYRHKSIELSVVGMIDALVLNAIRDQHNKKT
jgi:hypothetical protein